MAKFSTLSSGESRRTSSHLTSSSSAMIWASPVPTCWPISAFTICIVTLPSGVSVNQIEGVKLDMASAMAVRLPRAGRPMLRNVPAAVAAERTRNSRRLVAHCVDLSMAGSLIRHLSGPVHDLGGPLHGADDARVGGAATEIAVHADHDLLLDPGQLHWVSVGRVQALDRGDHRALNRAYGDGAGTNRLPIDVDSAATAKADSAAVFCP